MSFEEWLYEEHIDPYGFTRSDLVVHCTDDRPRQCSHDYIVTLVKEAWDYEDKDASI